MGKIVAVEGNIGVGKSTLMPKLVEHLGDNWEYLTERVDEDPEFQRLLKAFYRDPNKRIDLQHWLTQRRLKEYQALDPSRHYLMERSFLGDLVFCHANMMSHERPSGHYISYYYDVVEAIRQCRYDAVLYLQSSPERCFHSTLSRARDAETGIGFDYLKLLHGCYETFLPQAANEGDTRLLTVDWNDFGPVEPVFSRLSAALAA